MSKTLSRVIAMKPRAGVRSTLCRAGLLLGVLLESAWAEGTNQSLFVIERSKNVNLVQYDARLTTDGVLDPRKPVEVYWVLLAEDGRHEELSLLARKAYGIDTRRDPSGQSWTMVLAAYPKREITVRQTGPLVRAELLIAGKPSILEKLYIHSTEGRLLPTVNYIELHGRDLKTEEKRYERLVPD